MNISCSQASQDPTLYSHDANVTKITVIRFVLKIKKTLLSQNYENADIPV
jgi:hypothetical protein